MFFVCIFFSIKTLPVGTWHNLESKFLKIMELYLNFFLLCVVMSHLLDTFYAFKEMKCKVGRAQAQTGHSFIEESMIKDCPFEQYFCLMTTCFIETTDTAYALTDWQCSYDNNAEVCANETEQAWKKQFQNVRCKCDFGSFYESNGNNKPAAALPAKPTTTEQPTTQTPTEPPTETPNVPSQNLSCLRGTFNNKGYGFLNVDKCNKKEQFCFVAICKPTADTDNNKDCNIAWGCMGSNNCTLIAEKWSINRGENYECRCEFGEFGGNMTSENMTIPSWKPPPFVYSSTNLFVPTWKLLPSTSIGTIGSIGFHFSSSSTTIAPSPTKLTANQAPFSSCILKNTCDPHKIENAKFGRRFQLNATCQTVDEQIKKVPMNQIDLLGNEYSDGEVDGPKFLIEFVP